MRSRDLRNALEKGLAKYGRAKSSDNDIERIVRRFSEGWGSDAVADALAEIIEDEKAKQISRYNAARAFTYASSRYAEDRLIARLESHSCPFSAQALGNARCRVALGVLGALFDECYKRLRKRDKPPTSLTDGNEGYGLAVVQATHRMAPDQAEKMIVKLLGVTADRYREALLKVLDTPEKPGTLAAAIRSMPEDTLTVGQNRAIARYALALARMARKEHVLLLVNRLTEKLGHKAPKWSDAYLRADARFVEALGVTRDLKAMPVLKKAATSGNPHMQRAAQKVIKRIQAAGR